jgi:transcriptional regulator with XRE-family HTH domain
MKSEKDAHRQEVSQRLLELREACGYSQSRMASMIGVTAAAWNNWEACRKRIAIDAAIALYQKTGATLDWIYLGEGEVPKKLRAARR